MKSAVPLLSASALCLSLACRPAALRAQAPDRFAAYDHCRFSDDLALAEATPLAEGIEGRTVKTIMGNRNVPLAGGTRLMYAYPHTDFFANVKVEQIPARDYTQAKQDLIANFEQILTADDSSTRNYALKPRLNGLEIFGLDRRKLEGGVLGIYLFFVDRTHTATTIYFLNQDPAERKFDNLDSYAALRDGFLDTFTGCAAGHAHSTTSTVMEGQSKLASEAAPSQTPAPEPAALPDAPLPNGVPAEEAAPTPVPTIASKTAATQSVARRSKPAAAKTGSVKSAHSTPAKATTRRSSKRPAVKAIKKQD